MNKRYWHAELNRNLMPVNLYIVEDHNCKSSGADKLLKDIYNENVEGYTILTYLLPA
jgi:hypothetical protein